MAELQTGGKDATELFRDDKKGLAKLIERLQAEPGAVLYETDKHGNTRLHYHSLVGNTEIVALLLDSFKDRAGLEAYVNQRNDFDRIAMHNAARNGHIEIVKMLDVAGSDHLARDRAGDIPLSLARKGAANNGVAGYLEGRLVLRMEAAELLIKKSGAFPMRPIEGKMGEIAQQRPKITT